MGKAKRNEKDKFDNGIDIDIHKINLDIDGNYRLFLTELTQKTNDEEIEYIFTYLYSEKGNSPDLNNLIKDLLASAKIIKELYGINVIEKEYDGINIVEPGAGKQHTLLTDIGEDTMNIPFFTKSTKDMSRAERRRQRKDELKHKRCDLEKRIYHHMHHDKRFYHPAFNTKLSFLARDYFFRR